MNRRIMRSAAILSFLALPAFIAPGQSRQEPQPKICVVTTTTLIKQVVERVGKDRVEVVNIIPPAQCPGHFDVKPGDICKLAEADIFFLHGWQGEKFSRDLISSADNPDLTVVRLDIQGNWMIPGVQREAVSRISAALMRADENNRLYYEELSESYKESIAAREAEIRAKLGELDLQGVRVLCAEQQAGFVRWTGCRVVAAYGRPDSLTPRVVRDVVDRGRAEKVSLVIDNMQSGRDAGAGIAEELGCRRIVLSNFPGGYEDTGTWEKALERNIELLVAAITQ